MLMRQDALVGQERPSPVQFQSLLQVHQQQNVLTMGFRVSSEDSEKDGTCNLTMDSDKVLITCCGTWQHASSHTKVKLTHSMTLLWAVFSSRVTKLSYPALSSDTLRIVGKKV